jgi:RNA polymerase sigma factor, sigma-70 family
VEPSQLERFEAVVLPHLSAAYGLARYLTRNDADADDVVQEAFLRALRYFGSFRGEASQSRAWVLTIVRNTAHTWRRRHRADAPPRSSTRRSTARRRPTSIRNQRSRDATRARRWRRCSTACRTTCGR